MDTKMQAQARLRSFMEPILAKLGRAERRRWGLFYVQGLLLEGGRKTAASMAERFGGDEQAVQQFLNQSPWNWGPVRQVLAENTVLFMSPRCGWIVDDTGFPKKGKMSVGVARQYSGTLGKVGNCQIGVGLHYATDEACIPLDFSLYLPKEWIDDPWRCKRAGVPTDTKFKPKWQLALDMIGQTKDWMIPAGVIVTDAGYGVVGAFRRQLTAWDLHYVVGVQSSTGLWLEEIAKEAPAYQGRGRPRTRHYDLPEPQTADQVAQGLSQGDWHDVVWREGSKGPLQGRFAAVRAQASAGHAHGEIRESIGWLLIEEFPGKQVPRKYWLSSLPETTSLRELVYWAKLRWWVEQNYEQLKSEIGLDHFEGRSWTGWHHHVTMCMLAFNFLVLEKLRGKKNFWVDPPQSAHGTADNALEESWVLPIMPKAVRTSSRTPYLTK